MKIVLMSGMYRPYSRGGAETSVEQLADSLKDKHEVHIITTRPPDKWRDFGWHHTEESGFNVHRLCSANFFPVMSLGKYSSIVRVFWHLRDIFSFNNSRRIKNLLHEINPQLVLSHNMKGLGYWSIRAVPKGIKHIHTVHDIQRLMPSGVLLYGQENKLNSAVNKIYRAVVRWVFDSPDTVLFPSNYLAEEHRKYNFFPKSQKLVMPNPAPETTFDYARTTPHRKEITTYLYLGQLEKHKGVLWLLNTFTALPEEDIRLVIAGAGSAEQEILRAATRDSRIKYVGHVPHAAIGDLFSKTNFTVYPSLCYENAPMVIYESLAHAVPVLASKIGGIGELVESDEVGLTFAPGNTTELVLAIDKARTTLQYERWCQAAFTRSREYSLNRYLKTLLDLAGLKTSASSRSRRRQKK